MGYPITDIRGIGADTAADPEVGRHPDHGRAVAHGQNARSNGSRSPRRSAPTISWFSTGSPPPTACASKASAGNMRSCWRGRRQDRQRAQVPQSAEARRPDDRSQRQAQTGAVVAVGEHGAALDRERQKAAAGYPLLIGAQPLRLRPPATPVATASGLLHFDRAMLTAADDDNGDATWPIRLTPAQFFGCLTLRRRAGAASRPRRGRWSWACSTSRRTRFPTAAAFSIRRRRSRRRSRLVAEGADILDVGAESTRPYGGAVRVSARGGARASCAVLADVIALGVPVSIDTLKAASPPGRSITAPRSSTTSGACSAIPTWRASSPTTARRSSSCTIARAPIRRSTSSPT